MYIFSGKSSMGKCGTPTEYEDFHGKKAHVGDIVVTWHGEYLGTDIEQWTPSSNLTAVVLYDDGTPFVMGIKNCGFNDPAWRVQVVKSYKDVVDGEKWPSWGFNYMDESGDIEIPEMSGTIDALEKLSITK